MKNFLIKNFDYLEIFGALLLLISLRLFILQLKFATIFFNVSIIYLVFLYNFKASEQLNELKEIKITNRIVWYLFLVLPLVLYSKFIFSKYFFLLSIIFISFAFVMFFIILILRKKYLNKKIFKTHIIRTLIMLLTSIFLTTF